MKERHDPQFIEFLNSQDRLRVIKSLSEGRSHERGILPITRESSQKNSEVLYQRGNNTGEIEQTSEGHE